MGIFQTYIRNGWGNLQSINCFANHVRASDTMHPVQKNNEWLHQQGTDHAVFVVRQITNY